VEILRCLISDIPQKLLSDIIMSITQQHENIEVVDRVSNNEELDAILNTQSIDVLILGLQSNPLPDVCKDLLNKYSDLLILGLFDDGRMAAVYLDDVGSHEITKIIRTFGKRSGGRNTQ
jgi:DNA-binding NarL/FixJ family response regulator